MIVALILIVMGLCIYFLPSIWAEKHHHKNAEAIVILNLFLGWTFIGWVIALVWAAMSDSTKKTDHE